jgi:glutathionyl-hydroquinone reductase
MRWLRPSYSSLEDMISLSIVDPDMGDQGWEFSDAPGCIPDVVNGTRVSASEFHDRSHPETRAAAKSIKTAKTLAALI